MRRSIAVRIAWVALVALGLQACLFEYSEFSFDQEAGETGDAGVQGKRDVTERGSEDEGQ
jgi:hypothetical protein